MRPHPNYKETCLKWLPSIPDTWQLIRLRHVAGLNPSKREVANNTRDSVITFLPMGAIGEEGELDLSDSRPLQEVIQGFTYFRDGDVVVAKITPCFENGKGAFIRELPTGFGFGTTELTVLRPHRQIQGKFLYYLTVSAPVRDMGEAEMFGAGGQKRVPDDFWRDLKFGLPPLREQDTIVTFLDYETVRIDRLIEKQQRLIELLQEERQAIISHAVTKGLDPNAPMKDSGVEWLGRVPAHWEVIPLKRMIRGLESGVSVNAYNEPAAAHEVGILKTSCVYSREFRPEENKKVLEEELTRVSCPVRGGTLIISRMNTPGLVGAAAYVARDYPNLFLPDRLWQTILEPMWTWASSFLARVTVTPYYRQSIASIASGTSSSMQNIAQEDLMNIRIGVPPKDEYEKIEQRLEKTENYHRRLIDCAFEMIDRLKEHRTALISAAVTGKIDVRDWQPPDSANEVEERDHALLEASEERIHYG